MNFTKVIGIILVAVLGGAVVVGGCLYSGYNRAVGFDEEVKSAWAQVDNQLQRRFDLIDNLVATVKGFAAQEQDVFLGVAKTRESYFQAKSSGSLPDQAKAAGAFESALSRLLVLREAYPELKSNESFLKLQDSLEGTENRLAVERQRPDSTRNIHELYESSGGHFSRGAWRHGGHRRLFLQRLQPRGRTR